MSVFKVGMRVRVARPDAGSLKRGLVPGDQGVIHSGAAYVDFRVHVDGKSNQKAPSGLFPMFAYELEPILYDGNQVVSWSECLWKPEGVAA